MKTNVLLVSALLASSLFLGTSCKKDDSVAPVQENNVPNGTVGINLSVQVLASTQSARTEGLSGASVTISNGGTTSTVVVGESGIASFENLKEGAFSIYVKADGYTSINQTSGTLSYNGSIDIAGDNNGSGETHSGTDAFVVSASRIEVTLPQNGATIKGRLRADFNFDGTVSPSETEAGVKVYARIPNMYQPNVYTATTDASGNFSFTNLPDNVAVTLSTDYVKTNNTATPTYDSQFSFPFIGSQSARAGQVLQLSTLTLGHN